MGVLFGGGAISSDAATAAAARLRFGIMKGYTGGEGDGRRPREKRVRQANERETTAEGGSRYGIRG